MVCMECIMDRFILQAKKLMNFIFKLLLICILFNLGFVKNFCWFEYGKYNEKSPDKMDICI